MSSVEEVFDDADAVVLVTKWDQYLDLDWGKFTGLMRTPVLLDGRHCLEAARMERLGYRYLTTS